MNAPGQARVPGAAQRDEQKTSRTCRRIDCRTAVNRARLDNHHERNPGAGTPCEHAHAGVTLHGAEVMPQAPARLTLA